MLSYFGGMRRMLFIILAFVSFVAYIYEAIYLSKPHITVTIRGSSLLPHKYSLSVRTKTFLTRNHSSIDTNVPTFSELTQPNSSLEPVVKKLDTIYDHLNMSRGNNSLSIFPAYQIGEYLMLNPNICSDATIMDVIIIVHTAPQNFGKRQVARHTFANRNLFLPKQIRIAFLLGKPKDPSLEKELVIEHKTYNDTIMGDFYDDYHNLTLKGVMGYLWVGEYCPNAKVVLKIDDDVVVDMYVILSRYMRHIEGKKKSIFCNTWRQNMHINRVGKWRVPHVIFRGLKFFPYDYCSGMTVLFTTDLMKPLYEAAKVTPFFWIDDLFLYGILPKVVGGITYYDYKIYKNISYFPHKTLKCFKRQGLNCSFLSTLLHDGDNGFKFWQAIQLLRNNAL